MRLIDADKLNFSEQHYNKSQMKAILDFIDNQPTAYDVDKVIEELEAEQQKYAAQALETDDTDEVIRHVINEGAMQTAIEIVKRGGEDEI